MLAGQKELAPQEPLGCSSLMGGLAGQGHQAGVLYESLVRGHDARLGQPFWKHIERQDGVQGPSVSLPPIWGPQSFPGLCVYVVGGVCVYTCFAYDCIVWVVHLSLLCMSVCCVTIM